METREISFTSTISQFEKELVKRLEEDSSGWKVVSAKMTATDERDNVNFERFYMTEVVLQRAEQRPQD